MVERDCVGGGGCGVWRCVNTLECVVKYVDVMVYVRVYSTFFYVFLWSHYIKYIRCSEQRAAFMLYAPPHPES